MGTGNPQGMDGQSAFCRRPQRSSYSHDDDDGDDAERREEQQRDRSQEEAVSQRRLGWLSEFLGKFKSLELENEGSVARDHLAIERTFLAWLRTSVTFASIGIAITQLFRLPTASPDSPSSPLASTNLQKLGRPLGATFLAISILILLLGYYRYLQVQYWVLRGKYPASRGTVGFVGLVAFSVMVGSLVVIIVF